MRRYEPHPDLRQLERFLRGELTRAETGRVVRHLLTGGAGCRQCQVTLFRLGNNQDVSIEISTGSAAGHVLTPAGSRVPGALVSLLGNGPEPDIYFSGPIVETDKSGAFEFRRLSAGSYLLKVEKQGFSQKETSITVTPGGTVRVRVVLEPAKPSRG